MKKIFLFSLLSVLLTLGFSACTSVTDENSLSGHIPGDYSAYFKIDGAKMFEATNIKVDGDKVEVPAYLEKVIKPEEARILGIVNKNVKLDNIIGAANFGERKGLLVLAEISDYDGIINVLKEHDINIVSDKNDLEIFSDGNDTCCALYKKKYFYLFTEPDGETYMADVLNRVKNNPLSKHEGLAQALDGKDALDMVMNYDAYMENLPRAEKAIMGASGAEMIKGRALTGKMNFDANKMLFDCSMINLDGSPVEKIAELDDINIAVLGYVPENFNVIMASGKPSTVDPEYYDKAVNSCAPQIRPYIQMVMPYIKSIDGSTMMALRLQFPEITGGFSPEYFDGIFMTHMPMDKINEATTSIASALAMYNMRPVEAGEGLYSVNIGGINLYFGAVDGYFVVSTVPVSATHSSELTKYFVNRKSAAVFDGKCLAAVLPFAPFAVMQSENGTEVNTEITLEGTTEKFIPALVQAFSK